MPRTKLTARMSTGGMARRQVPRMRTGGIAPEQVEVLRDTAHSTVSSEESENAVEPRSVGGQNSTLVQVTRGRGRGRLRGRVPIPQRRSQRLATRRGRADDPVEDPGVIDLTSESDEEFPENEESVIVLAHRRARSPARRRANPPAIPEVMIVDDLQEVEPPGPPLNDILNSPSRIPICPICLECLLHGDIMSSICGHVFCRKCIAKSVELKSSCPVCRKQIGRADLHPIYLFPKSRDDINNN